MYLHKTGGSGHYFSYSLASRLFCSGYYNDLVSATEIGLYSQNGVNPVRG